MYKYLKYISIVTLFGITSGNTTNPKEMNLDNSTGIRALEMIPDASLMESAYTAEIMNQATFAKHISTPSIEPTPENSSFLESWNALPRITRKTLKNFQEGKRQGVLLVHSIEDFSSSAGLVPTYQNKISRGGVDQKFIDDYVNGVLAYRYHIACSIIGFGADGTHFPTFGCASLIISCDADHIVATSFQDCSSCDMIYPDDKPDERWVNSRRNTIECKSLDMLATFPNTTDVQDNYRIQMNEIVISPCAIKNGTPKYASVVGVLFDHRNLDSAERGMGNRKLHERAYKWFEYMKKFATDHQLPFIEIAAEEKYSVSPSILKQKYIKEIPDALEKYILSRHKEDHEGDQKMCDACKKRISEYENNDHLSAYVMHEYISTKQMSYRFSKTMLENFGLEQE